MPDVLIPVHSNQSPRLSTESGIPVREDVAFADSKGEERRGIRKFMEQALEKLRDPLLKFLEPDEAVFYIAAARHLPKGFRPYLLGWDYVPMPKAMLVLTNRRILHFMVSWRGKWLRSLRAARWGDIETAKVRTFWDRRLDLKYRDGRKESFARLHYVDPKPIAALLGVMIPAGAGETSPALSMASLCPECRSELTPRNYTCSQCHLVFKNEKTAVRRTWLVPGGEFFYTGHPLLGFYSAFWEVVFMFILVLALLNVSDVMHAPPPAGQPAANDSFVYFFPVIVLGLLIFGKLMKARMARKMVQMFIPAS